MGDTVLLNREEGKAEIILNRPPNNRFNLEMIQELVRALDPLRDDESLKVLVIKGASGNFSSGIEVIERTTEHAGLMMPEFTRVFDYLNDISGLTVAMVEGEAHDGGFELASFCDIIFASSGATFKHPEIEMGLFPPFSAAVLPRLVGRNKALEWILSGDVVTSTAALNSGLVNRVWAEHEVAGELEKFVAHIDSLSAPAVIWAKRAIDRSLYTSVMEGMRTSESIYMVELMRNIDPLEGINAALENRKPIWRNL